MALFLVFFIRNYKFKYNLDYGYCMKKIILDTDFLIDCVKYKIDLFSEIRRILDVNYKVYIIDKTLEELGDKGNFGLIKALLERNNIDVLKTKKDKKVDDLILDLVDNNHIVATQDRELKRKLKEKGISVITIRQKSYLVLS